MTITFVKKILASGEPCPKCRDVEARLDAGGHWPAIDRIAVADERDPTSDGLVLAARYGVERAPFFIVEKDNKTIIYTIYLKFEKEVLGRSSAAADAQALLQSHPELDLL